MLSFYSVLCASEVTHGAVGWNSASRRNIGALFAESISQHWKTLADCSDRDTVIGGAVGAAIVPPKDLV